MLAMSMNVPGYDEGRDKANENQNTYLVNHCPPPPYGALIRVHVVQYLKFCLVDHFVFFAPLSYFTSAHLCYHILFYFLYVFYL